MVLSHWRTPFSAPNYPCRHSSRLQATASVDPLLLRVARGEDAERTPVWLMRQAGRYMADFRKYSEKIGFRERSETADIAIELSLQPWRAFKPDGVIMFSDILTPLPAMGIEFDVVKGKGPIIEIPVRSLEQVGKLQPLADPDEKLSFVGAILAALRQEVGSESTVLGFIGAPWTLAAYAVEGKADKHCMKTKQMMFHSPEVLHALLSHLADQLVHYVAYQIQSGAQVVQLFESWAHHLSPAQFEEFGRPYAERVLQGVKALHPEVPLIYHANGGTGKLHVIKDMAADVIGLDWSTDMITARKTLGRSTKVQGNVDPMVLFASEDEIRRTVLQCMDDAGVSGHILNVGHGVAQGTPEENVGLFCRLAHESGKVQRSKELATA